MATWYVDSTATGTAAGTSWANACLTLAAAITLSAAGDDFNVYSGHAETTASALNFIFKGTAAARNRVFSCDRTNTPAQAGDLLAGATITTTGASNLTMSGFVYIFGVTFKVGTGTTATNVTLGASSDIYLDTCAIKMLVTTATCFISLGNGVAGGKYTLDNTSVSFNGGVNCVVQLDGCTAYWKNTPSAVGGTQTALANLISSGGGGGVLIVEGCDLTGVASGKNIVGASSRSQVVQLLNCKLTSGALIATPAAPGCFTDLIVSDSGSASYRQERYQYPGTLTASTSVFNAASDGTTPISWQIVTNANPEHACPFECFEIVKWAAPGTYAATLVNVVSATTGLTNADIWVEAQVLDNASFPVCSKYTSGIATELTAGSALPTGATWSNPPASPTYYALELPSFTVAIAGYVRFTVKVAKPSLTVYVDPDVTLA